MTSAGWRPHAQQVGQTGTRIAPDLYIACGISGAIQHMVGARSAKAILAINTDRDAPMVTRATYAVIGDLHTVLPAIIAAFGRLASGRHVDSGVLLPVGPRLAGRPDVGAHGRADGRVDVVRGDALQDPIAAQPVADRVLQLGECQGDPRLRQILRESIEHRRGRGVDVGDRLRRHDHPADRGLRGLDALAHPIAEDVGVGEEERGIEPVEHEPGICRASG